MSQSSDTSFLLKVEKSATKKQNYFSLILVTGLVILIVFIKLQCDTKDVLLTHSMVKNDFDWLRNKNYLPLYVRPHEDTAVHVPRNISEVKERQFIACFVISAPKNSEKRDAVRQTWGKLIKPIFLIGQNDKETMRSVTHEAKAFNDIIIEDFVDSYVNLTIKTAFAMKSFLTHFKDSKYFFKIDDDTFLNVEGFYELLKTAPEESLIGQKESHSIPIRDENHRWYIPEFLFPGKVFPPYFVGLSYVIPGHLMQSIYNTSMTVPFMTLEDVFFTGVVAGKMLNYNLFDTKKFKVEEITKNDPCLYLQYVTVHKISPRNLLKLWKKLESHKEC